MSPTDAAIGGEPRTLPVSFHAYRLAHAGTWLDYARVHLDDPERARTLVTRALLDLARTWAHALRRPNVHAYAWALFRRHLDQYGPHPARIAVAASPHIPSLPGRHYDVLILRTRLRCSAEQVADLLGTTADGVRCDLRWALRRSATHPGTTDPSEDIP
ncbi:hypothetical protein [Embleya sp. MST-111070]|uniref:hypothetical protein n=1 Tax=Embleya sp. MST-111070 TaxID=3398231 RepID=UPI003F7386B0